jgi:hypothetical protein
MRNLAEGLLVAAFIVLFSMVGLGVSLLFGMLWGA